MGIRFRKSFKLASGVRLNVSGSGFGWTLGPRGASVGIGKRGTYLNGSLPGGFSFREQLTSATSRSQPTSVASLPERHLEPETTKVSLTCSVRDDGTLQFLDADGRPAPETLIEKAKRQKRDEIAALIQGACDRINNQVEALGQLHLDTPDPEQTPRFWPSPYLLEKPERPTMKPLGFWGKLLPFVRKRVERENAMAEAVYRAELEQWTDGFNKHQIVQEERREFIERAIIEDPQAMETFLEERLAEIVWPRETSVSAEIAVDGSAVRLDVDLPEIEDFPSKTATVPVRGLKLSVKEMSPSKVEKLYADHLHGLVFRLVGEVFAALPKCQEVIISGYSQRADAKTGRVQDEYLLSVKCRRSEWMQIDFGNVKALDPVQALAQFDLRRPMLKAGRLKAIAPHDRLAV